MPHHHDHSDDEHEHDAEEWVQLLSLEEKRQVQELDRAKREVERQMIHANEAKLAGKSMTVVRGNRRVANPRTVGFGTRNADVMSHLHSQDVDVDRIASLLPRPGDGEKTKQMPFQKMWDALAGARFSPWYAGFSMFVVLTAVCIYLYETTLDAGSNESGGGSSWTRKSGVYPSWFAPLQDIFLAFFLFDVLVGAVMADHDWGFWMATETIVEVLSLMPSFLFVAFNLRLWGFLLFLRLFRWSDIVTLDSRRPRYLRVSEMDKAIKKGDEMDGGVLGLKYESMIATLKLTAFVLRYILVFAGAALLIDRAEGGIEDISAQNSDEPLSYGSAVYMAIMMLTTIGEGGYGPVPVSTFARLATAAAVVVFLPLAAIRLGEVVRHADTSDALEKRRTSTPALRERHVVALGSITESNIRARLKEVFHVDHGKHNTRWVRAVIVSPNPATRGIRALLESPLYRGRVTYIQGSALDDDILEKARVDQAAAVMVLANKLAPSSHVEDMNVSLQAISVLTNVELQRRQGWGPRLMVEVLDPNAAIHLRTAGIKQVLSSDQLKLSVLAQSCLCPGWSAVVANLLESRAALPPQVLEQGSWLAEYYVGAKKTFYSVEFSPNFAGMLFEDAVVHIFELFELILVAVESRRAGAGEPIVLVNPSGGYRIGRGDRAFVLAESQADARVVWDFMAEQEASVELSRASRFETPEEEEASALESLGTTGIATMSPEAFVDSMIFSRTLLRCQRRLPAAESPDPSLIIEWARQFQGTAGMTNLEVVRRTLARSGLTLPPPNDETAALYIELGIHPDRDASTGRTHPSPTEGRPRDASAPSTASATSTTISGGAADDALARRSLVNDGPLVDLSGFGNPVPPLFLAGNPAQTSPAEQTGPAAATATAAETPSMKVGHGSQGAETGRGAEGVREPEGRGVTGVSSVSAAGSAAEGVNAEDILHTLKTMEVSAMDSEAVRQRLVDLQAAAEIAIASRATGEAPPSPSPAPSPAGSERTPPPATGKNRRIKSAQGWKGHVVVLGFPARPSHMECFLRPLKGWAGRSGEPSGGGRVPVVLMAKKVDMLESALEVVERSGEVNTSDVYLLEGSSVSHMDLNNAGVRTAKVVLIMKDSRRRAQFEGEQEDGSLRDAEALMTFTKMEDGLLTQDQHVVVELETSSNVRFLHTRSEASSLRSIAGLGGAGRGGPADDAHYLWPKYAAGMTYNASFLDSLFGQAFYRPSRLALIERLLLLDRDSLDTSQAHHSTHRRRRRAAALGEEENEEGGVRLPDALNARMVKESCLRQMVVPSSFLGHSFGELFQHLAAPPLRCVAFSLLRSKGTRNAPEPYVYTGPRADTVLHEGDRVFVLGCPPEL